MVSAFAVIFRWFSRTLLCYVNDRSILPRNACLHNLTHTNIGPIYKLSFETNRLLLRIFPKNRSISKRPVVICLYCFSCYILNREECGGWRSLRIWHHAYNPQKAGNVQHLLKQLVGLIDISWMTWFSRKPNGNLCRLKPCSGITIVKAARFEIYRYFAW